MGIVNLSRISGDGEFELLGLCVVLGVCFLVVVGGLVVLSMVASGGEVVLNSVGRRGFFDMSNRGSFPFVSFPSRLVSTQ